MMATAYPHSIPTPHNHRLPDETVENPLKSTINLLDSLIAFYQYERMWVYRTRAMLEDAFDTPHYTGNTQSHSSVPESDYPQMEPQSPHFDSSSSSHQDSRWLRRKKGFKLRLEGLSPKSRRIVSLQPVGQNPPASQSSLGQPREQILEMFDKMMEARMESCQRVNKLVQNANRANLYNR